MYILCIHIIYKLSLGQTASFKFFFFALWWICWKGIFFTNKGFDAYSFLCEMGSIVPWGKLHSENQSSCDPLRVLFFLNPYDASWLLLTMFVIRWFVSWSLVDAIFCTAEVKSRWLRSCLLISVWTMQQQNQNGWTDFLCFVNIKNNCSVCVFYVVVKYFLKVKLHLSR